jgi:uncharacterized membrane protein
LCIDRLTQVLLALGKRRPPAPLRTREGKVHFIALLYTFAGAVEDSFRDILHHGKDNPVITARLRQAIHLLQELLPAERHEPLAAFHRRLCALM